MAELILRPVGDISLTHSCSSGQIGYVLINEETADDDAGYIYQIISGTTMSYLSSTFKLSGAISGKIKATGLKLCYSVMKTSTQEGCTGGISTALSVNGEIWKSMSGNLTSVQTSYSSGGIVANIQIPASANVVFDNLDNANIVLTIKTGGTKKQSKQDDFQVRLTQIYAILTYEEVSNPETGTGLYFKSNDSWMEAKSAYKKVSGTWVEQTDLPAIFSGESSGTASNYVYGGSV